MSSQIPGMLKSCNATYAEVVQKNNNCPCDSGGTYQTNIPNQNYTLYCDNERECSVQVERNQVGNYVYADGAQKGNSICQ